jgi:pantoate--beta-alanine ligase
MKVISTVKDMAKYVRHNNRKGRSIGLVPTMGYFHDGHTMLIREARKKCDRLVVSIFVNPLQFGRGEDFAAYPRDMKRDLSIARSLKANVVFAPSSEELYPQGYSTYVEEERLSKRLCGPFRPGHFKGVLTVVAKLFNIVQPHFAAFGRKDAQQAAVIKKMVTDLGYPVKIMVLPIIREKSGLACSSRNKYLSAREKKEAAVIYQTLREAEDLIRAGERTTRKVLELIKTKLSSAPLVKAEYVEAVHPDSLEPLRTISGKVLIAVAARVGKTRLIDNIVVEA